MEESYVSDPALPLSLSISFPSNVSLGDTAIWLFIAAWAELLDVSFGIWSWFYDFSIIPLHFLYVSFASLELLLHQWTLSPYIPCTFTFSSLPRASQHSCLVSAPFIPFFFLTFLCFLLAQGAPSHSETVDWAQASASLCYNPIHPGSRRWPQRHCWRRKGKMQTIPEEVQPWSSTLG